MRAADWLVLVGTLAAIIGVGVYMERGPKTAERFMRGGHDMKWWTIGLSIMATQASAITFLSLPGQAYESGMGFLQFYFGLPLAMVILSIFVVPIYYRLKVYTAYEYLESRFDRKTRVLTAFLFLLSRGLAAGISIYAPAIVLSTVLGWPLQITNIAIGVIVILYTVSGGTRVVSRTQSYQMLVMLGGMAAAFIFIVKQLPANLSIGHAVAVAGALGKMKIVDYSLRVDTRYTFWSGMTGGLFVALAYFGTDQSQVQRYLSGASLRESRLGLLFNGLVKVPMQFLILFVGVLLFVFYQFNTPPVLFNEAAWRAAPAAERAVLDGEWKSVYADRRASVQKYVAALDAGDATAKASVGQTLAGETAKLSAIRTRAEKLAPKASDADYVFISFVMSHFPVGLVGLLVAVILCAAMSATASALSSLGSTTVVDFYKLFKKSPVSDDQALQVAKLFTVMWGVVAVGFAAFASLVDNLIVAVNILGSIFYGPMLGVFLVGFFLRHVRANAAFIAMVVAQAAVVAVFAFTSIGFLWYNVIGCAVVVGLALALSVGNRASPAAP